MLEQLGKALEATPGQALALAPRLLVDAESLLHSTEPLEEALPHSLQLAQRLRRLTLITGDVCTGFLPGDRGSTSLLELARAVESLVVAGIVNLDELAASDGGPLHVPQSPELQQIPRHLADLVGETEKIVIRIPGGAGGGFGGGESGGCAH